MLLLSVNHAFFVKKRAGTEGCRA